MAAQGSRTSGRLLTLKGCSPSQHSGMLLGGYILWITEVGKVKFSSWNHPQRERQECQGEPMDGAGCPQHWDHSWAAVPADWQQGKDHIRAEQGHPAVPQSFLQIWMLQGLFTPFGPINKRLWAALGTSCLSSIVMWFPETSMQGSHPNWMFTKHRLPFS